MPFTPSTRLLLACLVATVAAASMQVPASSQEPRGSHKTVVVDGHPAVANEVLVRFVELPAAVALQANLEQQIDADLNVAVGRHGVRRYRSRAFDTAALLAFFQGQPGVVFAEPNYILTAAQTPNDPQFSKLWGLLNIGQTIRSVAGIPGADISATGAWEISTGSRSSVIAVIDSGINYLHGDLAANVWSAPTAFTVTVGGAPLSCPAGSHGYNAIARSCDPMDDNGHGTHVAGTIGAVGNNGIGVAGVNWTASIIAGKFLNSIGTGTTADAIDTIDFMIQVKAAFSSTGGANIRVLNNSWGGGAFSTALRTAIENANTNNMLFVAAAGNAAVNTDVTPFYPASYDVANIVAVASTTNRDALSGFSSYGATSVDLAAPGSDIYSTAIGGGYEYQNGTSMATPQVAGAAALVLSECTLTTAALKDALLSNVDPLALLAGRVATGGRLNVDRAIRSCDGLTPPTPPTGLTATPGDGRVNLIWSPSPGASSYNVKRGPKLGPFVTFASPTGTSQVDLAVVNGTKYFYVVSAVNTGGESGNSARASAVPGSIPATPGGASAVTGTLAGQIDVSWNPSAGAANYSVKRSKISGGPYTVVSKPTATSLTDASLVSGRRYYYVVLAINANGKSAPSAEVSAIAR